jgi:hypothetical protein
MAMGKTKAPAATGRHVDRNHYIREEVFRLPIEDLGGRRWHLALKLQQPRLGE